MVTIFSIWNAMVGTGLVTIPWAYSESGLLLGLCIYNLFLTKTSDNICMLYCVVVYLQLGVGCGGK